MNSAVKWFIIIGGGLVVLIIVVLIAIPFFVDINKYKPEIEKRVAAATGRSFSIGSDLDFSLFPFAGIKFSKLRLGSPNQFSEKEFAAIDDFEVRGKLLPLLSKEVEIKRFIMNRPRIVLVKNKNGAVNWDFSTDHEKKSTNREKKKSSPQKMEELPIKRLDIQEFFITDGALTYIDHGSGMRKQIKGLNLELADVSLDKPIQVKFSVDLDEKPMSLDGKIGPIGKEPGKNGIFHLKPLALKLYRGDMNISGVLNVQQDTPATSLEVLAKGIQANPLIKDLINKDILEGTTFVTAASSSEGMNRRS